MMLYVLQHRNFLRFRHKNGELTGTVEPRFKQLFARPKKVACIEVLLISGFCIYYIKAQNYRSFLLKTSHSHLNHAILMFPGTPLNSVTPKAERKQNNGVIYGVWSDFYTKAPAEYLLYKTSPEGGCFI